MNPSFPAGGQRASSPASPDDPVPLDAFVDVLGFDVPPSQHARWGGAITRLKQVAVVGLGPVQQALLARQARFNALLAELLREPRPSVPARVRSELAPLTEPAAPESGPASGVGQAMLGQARRWLRETWGEAQHAWNLEVVGLLSGPSWPPRTEGARARLDALEARCDVLARARPPRVLLPLLREVLRRQVAFNHACVRKLRHMLGAARPVMCLPRPEAYARQAYAQEARDVPEAVAALTRLEHRPLFSLVTPAWETPAPVLRACIESVLAQVYPHWELCIVDDGSRSPEVEAVVRRFAAEDSRIRFARLPSNQGIARATNAALELATGDFIGFLDHDDLLAPHALAEVALRLAAAPDTDVLYSDEDKVDEAGARFAPYLKPELSPELLRAVNYVCHFLVVRASLMRDVGGIRPGFEGAQDHDLVLRLLERTRRFAHIPKVLYHWRTLPGSTATDASTKPAASEAGRRAVVEHLARLGEAGEVESQAPGLYRIRHPLPRRASVSVLLTGPGAEDSATLAALLDTAGDVDLEVLLPRSGDAALDAKEGGRARHVRVSEGLSPGAVANHLLREARGEVVLRLEAGMVPTEQGWLTELASQALRPDVGVVGARIVTPAGTLVHAGLTLTPDGGVARLFSGLPDPSLTAFGGSHWPRELLAVSGACAMSRREVLERLGGWDEGLLSAEACAVDLCLRAVGMGLRVVYTPQARLVSTVETPDGAWDAADLARLRARAGPWPGTGRGDPFGNPHVVSGGAGGMASREG
ncbi:glycosyltransferase [Pyxidicoccus fallax]|uniref:Glycosyltransferase n=1 Tax=Pyxidicoccus fallax TaxID=394095 RepID=A0A848LRY6_9BACT|nr:glycosyltransferase [Pyxidicoccus fallax]NMO20390.1 glycosyltransferase [Pyxidicoccus fallax]NPC81130.1 glycosyltransferase [Pyxidicoccus fallax]